MMQCELTERRIRRQVARLYGRGARAAAVPDGQVLVRMLAGKLESWPEDLQRVAEGHATLLRKVDAELSMLVLGQTLTLATETVGGGSYAREEMRLDLQRPREGEAP